MIRVTTLYASGAGVSAAYYTGYLTKADGEQPGVWAGSQAVGLGLAGEVTTEALEALLSGHHPTTGMQLGRGLEDRVDRHGNTIKAVAGYDATLSAPKSLSVLWGLTGDDGFAECHDVAVNAVVRMIERYGSTTRIRSNGSRLHPETQGLTVGVFRQSTSRADDPQLHTHVVISSKVQTADGRWYALDALMLKKYQQAFGYLYQSVLRAEVTARYGVVFDPIVNGQAEIAGVPTEVLEQFSKRAREIDAEMGDKLADFAQREGRDPTDFEYAAMEREAAVDTRSRKSGLGVSDLRSRWEREAANLGIDATTLTASIAEAAMAHPLEASPLDVSDVIGALASRQSTWNRMDVLRTLCDTVTPQPGHDGTSWANALDASVNTVLESCIDLDPIIESTSRRGSDGRSVWIEPITNQSTSEHILTQEEHIVSWALDAQADDPTPSATITDTALDDGQHASASAVAGHDRLVLIVGPAGAGKTRMLQAAVSDLHAQRRAVMGLAPTAKAARVLETETGMIADTVAKLLYELDRPDSDESSWDAGPGMTVIVDEAGMLNTSDLSRLITHAEQRQWRLALVGDPHQLQAVGRGGMFLELCDTGRRVELEHLHRFTNRWEAAASLELRHGNPFVLDTYSAHGRIRPGTFAEHLGTIADLWQECQAAGESLSITTTRTEHVNAINDHIQQRRLDTGQLDEGTLTPVADSWAMVGDVVATRRNDRRLRTSVGEPVRNRERWTVSATDSIEEGDVTVTRLDGHGTITLPRDYVREHVQLAYATTEPGAQGDTSTCSVTLATTATTRRGLYMAMTRGERENLALVVTQSHDLAEARSVLEGVLIADRADIPAVVQRRALAATVPASLPQKRIQVPAWFDQVRADAEEHRLVAQQRLDERNTERAAAREQVALARRELPGAEAAHEPFAEQVDAAGRIVNEAQSALRDAQAGLRRAGRIHRRSARRDLEAASDVLAVATDRLTRAEELATPTRRRVNELRNVIDDHHRMDSTRRMFDDFNDLEGVAHDAGRLCHALDQWKHWANGRNLDNAALAEIAATLRDHHDRPGISQLAAPLDQWARRRGLELEPPTPTTPTRSSMGIEIGF
jgi:conjugative relaxase-like TrwC/TraI family protein